MVRKSKSRERKKSASLKIFISHSERDRKIVEKIAERLRAQGDTVWQSRSHLKAGENFQKMILEELEGADVRLIIVSKNSFRSEWVQQEFATIALQQEVSGGPRPIIPIKVDEVSVPSYLAHLQYLDFSQDFDFFEKA